MQLRAGRIGELFERETAAFEAANPRSRELLGRSGCSLFGGVPMSWMMMWAGGFPLFAASAEGSTITDVDGLTGFACAIYYRRVLLRSVKNLVLMGLAPAVGGLMLTWAFVQSVINLSNPKEAYSGAVIVIGTPLFIGIVAMLLGTLLMAWSWYAKPDFFRNPLSATPVQAPGTEEPGERG